MGRNSFVHNVCKKVSIYSVRAIQISYMLLQCYLALIETRVAQCIDKEILIRKICNIDIGIDIDKVDFEKC